MVTVVMPIHGKPTWLAQALDSVRSQTFTNWEFLGFLDGANPEAKEILESFGARFGYFSSVENNGAPAARNFCMRKARGKYIATLDSDDIWSNDHLEAQVRRLESQEGLVLIGCSAQKIDASGDFLDETIVVPERELSRELLRRNIFVHSSTVYRRDAALQVGGYDPEVEIGEDYYLWLRLVALGEIGNNSGQIIYYRAYPEQWSQQRPSWPSLNAIGVARYEGAKALGVSLAGVRFEHWLWVLWQWLPPALTRLAPFLRKATSSSN